LSRATRLSAVALTAVGVVVATLVASPAAAADSATAITTETATIETTPANETAATTETAPATTESAPATTQTAPATTESAPAPTVTPPATAATVTRIVTRARLTTRQHTVHPGQRARLTASVAYGAHAARVTRARVYLQYRRSGLWRTVTSRPLSGRGYATFVVKPARSTAYRLVFRSGYGRFTGSVSATRVVRRTPWPASALRARVVRAAAKQVGKPYVFGATGPRAFDCSGLTQYAFRKAGVRLAHQSTAQAHRGRWVSRTAARPGDLVVFYFRGYAYHVAVYAGGGYIYEASNPGRPIGKHRLWSSSVSFRRLIG
jgi:cell wall-associated NlpC family hydrolase